MKPPPPKPPAPSPGPPLVDLYTDAERHSFNALLVVGVALFIGFVAYTLWTLCTL